MQTFLPYPDMEKSLRVNALKLYFNKAIEEWAARGYKNNIKPEVIRGRIAFLLWIKNRKFHSSHKSNLLRKGKEYYSRFGWKESPGLPYVWPA